MTYWEKTAELDPHDLDQVGITLEKRDSGYFISGIAEKDDKRVVSDVRIGDRLVQVDDVPLQNATPGRRIFSFARKGGDASHPYLGKGWPLIESVSVYNRILSDPRSESWHSTTGRHDAKH